MSVYIHENDDDGGWYADTVHQCKRASHSKLLGPDGNPLPYKQPPKIGFDLTPRGSK